MIESNTNAAYLPAAIRAVYERPRFVHIVRDGREVVRSLYSKKGPSRRGRGATALFMDHDDARCRLGAPDFPHDEWADEWDRMSRFERIVWHWSRKNAFIRQALGGGPDNLTLRFEDIFDREGGFQGYWRLIDFLRLGDRLVLSRSETHELLSARSNDSTAYLIPPAAQWSADLAATFERIGGAEQRLYYDEARKATP